MSHQVQYSPLAIQDLKRVLAEVLEVSKNPSTANKYISELMDKVESKKNFPKSGSPLYYEDVFTGYYYVVFKEYMAFYHVTDEALLVDRILYRRSDYMRWIFG